MLGLKLRWTGIPSWRDRKYFLSPYATKTVKTEVTHFLIGKVLRRPVQRRQKGLKIN